MAISRFAWALLRLQALLALCTPTLPRSVLLQNRVEEIVGDTYGLFQTRCISTAQENMQLFVFGGSITATLSTKVHGDSGDVLDVLHILSIFAN